VSFHHPRRSSAPSAATTAAASATEATATTAEATATTAKTSASAAEAAAGATQPAAGRSHAGGATIAIAPRVRSIESPGTASEGTPVSRATSRKIPPADAIGSSRAHASATAAIPHAALSRAVGEASGTD
jgi:hypothetical protein